MRQLVARAWSDTWHGMERPVYWIAALILPGAIGAFVTPVLPDGSLVERAISALISGVATFVFVSACWFFFNLLHAGNRLTIAALAAENATVQADLAHARANAPPKTDDEIIAALSQGTKSRLISFEKELLRGQSLYTMHTEVIAELAEHELVERSQEITPVFGEPKLIPFVRLNSDGLRILRKLKES